MDCAVAGDTVGMSRRYQAAEIEVHLPRVYRALITLGARVEEAEDATQDAAERALASVAPIDRVDAWLYVVATRRWRQRRFRDRLLRPLEWARSVVPAPGLEGVGLLGELARLPRRQREVLVARYVVGLSQKETAAVLGIAQGTVSATQAQATKKLRERLGDGYDR
jgi:DNA-directed RNA polymerase specialized sigma24 family protein